MAAWAELGVVPAEAVEAVRTHARIDVDRIGEIERRTHHDVLAFTESVAERVGEHGRWFHYGLTSSDVVDTGLALQLRDAGELLLAGVDAVEAAAAVRAEEFRHTPIVGRTHGVHAEPTTFGLKVLGWVTELRRQRVRLQAAFDGRARRQALGRGGRLLQLRPAHGGSRACRPRSRPRGRRHPGRAPRPPRRAALGHRRRRRLARAVRARDPPPAAHRGARGARAVRRRTEGLLGDAPQAQPDRVRAHLRPGPGAARERPRRPRGHRPVARARHLALLGRAGRPARLDHRPRLHARPRPLADRGPRGRSRADAAKPRGLARPRVLGHACSCGSSRPG